MPQTLHDIYGAGILFFYYLKWPLLLGYPALLYGAGYPRHWSMDILWVYCAGLALKDFVSLYRTQS